MKRDEKTVAEIMSRALSRHSRPPAEQVESASDRVWQRVQSRRSNRSVEVVPDEVPVPLRRRVWLPVAVAVTAVMVLAVFLSRPREEGTAQNRAAESIRMGEFLRSDDQGTVFTLADGSRIEMRAKSELRLESADDGVRIRLNSGGVIVTAAKQRTGHLYVQTKDVTVSVVGTVFFVNAEEEGSRVAVIQGEVQVQHGTTFKKLFPGEQVATNPAMESHPVSEEIAWSRSAEMHLALLQESKPVVHVPLQFDAASIKRDPSPFAPGLRGPVLCRGTDGVLSSMIGPKEPGAPPPLPPLSNVYPGTVPLGRCIGRYTELVELIAAAYGVQARNISGGPEWTGEYRAPVEHFQIEATSENPASTTKEQLRQMLQTLLADRFKLKVRRETKQAPGFALVVANGGLKARMAEGGEERFSMLNTGGGPITRTISGKGSISAFASFLEGCPSTGTPFIDKTELPGIYDFKLTLSFSPTAPPGPLPPGAPVRSCRTRPQYDPPLSKALEDQLGLGLLSQPVPEDFVVIEYAEKPSEN